MVDVRGPLLAGAIALGTAAALTYPGLPLSGWLPDLTVGLGALGLALISWRSCGPVSTLSLLLAATWWAGTIWPAALYWHRGVLLHLVLSVPRWWPRSRAGGAAVVAGYVAALAAPVWQDAVTAAGLAVAILVVGIVEARSRRRPRRHGGAVALLATAVVTGLVAPELIGSEAGPTAAVLAYDLLLIGVLGVVGLLARSPTLAELTDLAVDLGRAPVRDVAALSRLVEAEPGLAADADLQAALAAARRLEGANQEVRDRVREAVVEVDRSRRRLVVAASRERRRLAHELAATAEVPLRELVDRAAGTGLAVPGLTRAAARLQTALLGLRPPALAQGLSTALREHPLAVALDARLEVTDGRCDEVVEDTLYAVAVESLTNAAKYAGPCAVAVRFSVDGTRATLTVADDGVGGASPGAGSGLAGLIDRLEALGGGLDVASPSGGGTTITAWAPRALSEAGPRRPSTGSRPAAP